MKKESTALYILRLTVTLLLICAVVALALAGVNAITKDKIAAVKAEKTAKAISAVLENGETAVEVPYQTDGATNVTKVYKNDNGYAVEVAPNGFGGAITMMVGVDFEGNVLEISVVNQTETAGLGAVCGAENSAGEAFRGQFVGMSGELAVTKDGGQVDAITGATVTSRAVTAGVNAALDCVENMG